MIVEMNFYLEISNIFYLFFLLLGIAVSLISKQHDCVFFVHEVGVKLILLLLD